VTAKIKARAGSSNVFADLGLPNPETELLRAEMTRRISSALKAGALKTGAMTQVEAAQRLGVKQPDISRLISARPTRFSVERLIRILNALGQDVTVSVEAAPKRRPLGRVRIVGPTAPGVR
jgi:predicted XRE-type DNA-binding protein